VESYKLQGTRHKAQGTGYKVQVTGYRLQVTRHPGTRRRRVTGYWLWVKGL